MKELIDFRKKVYLFFFRHPYVKKQGGCYFALLLLSTAAVLFTPQVYSVFIDRVLIGGEFSLFRYIVLAYLILYLISAFSSAVQCSVMNRMCNTFEYTLRLCALNNVIRLQKKNRDRNDLGEIKMKIDNDISSLASFFREQFGIFEMQILLTAGSAALLLTISLPLALCGILAVPLTLWLDDRIGQKENVLNEENRRNDSRMSSWLHSVVKGWRQIRMFGQEKNQERVYVRFQHKYALYNAKWINYWVTRSLIIPKLKNEFLMEFGVYVIGGLLMFSDWMTTGQLLVFIVYYRQMTDSMTSLSSFQASLKSRMPVYQRAFSGNVESSTVDPDYPEKKTVSEIDRSCFLKQIELENITFRYSKNTPFLLYNLCGKYKTGDCVGIKGRSGFGKSTLLKVLLGIETPYSGEIRINGKNLNRADLQNYYRHVSGYMQGSWLFNTTIRKNLLYAVPGASEEEILKACEKAQILGEILKMPQQFDTVVGERGCLLSGGQCQRVLLARAFLKDAELYYFDEPASALDERTAEMVYREIGKLKEKSMVFLAAHGNEADKICNKFICL